VDERHEHGACFCGAIVAQLTGEPFWVCYDHDEYCRRATGGALVVWVGYRPEQLQITSGKLKSFSKTRGVVRTFCSECGTSISYADEGIPNEVYATQCCCTASTPHENHVFFTIVKLL